MNCDPYTHVRPAEGCADNTKRWVLVGLVLLGLKQHVLPIFSGTYLASIANAFEAQ